MRYGMLIDLSRCIGCGACAVACKQENGTPKDVYYTTLCSREVGRYPNAKQMCIPIGCMQCQDAPCESVCPVGATYTENGMVLVNQEACVGCRACLNACPYGARYFNFDDPLEHPYWGEMGATPFEQAKAAQHRQGTAEKCMFCLHRVNQGLQPACVATCVTKARIFGDLDDPNSELVRQIRERNGRPLRPELGTNPSVFYAGDY